MAMMTIAGVDVRLSLASGVGSSIEDLSDRARSVAGSLLITQLSGTAGAAKETLRCQTVPLSTADRDTLVTALRSAAIHAVTGDIGARNAAAVITSINPVTLPGPTRRWVVSFDLIDS